MTGVVDDKTMEMMEKPRCGMPDFGRTDKTKKRKKRYAVQGTVWQKKVSLYRRMKVIIEGRGSEV